MTAFVEGGFERGEHAGTSALREAASHHIERVLDLEFGRQLERDDLRVIAAKVGARAIEAQYDVGMNLTVAGEEVRQLIFLVQGDAEVLIGGKVVTTMHAPCLIGESALQLLGDGREGAFGRGSNETRSTSDTTDSGRVHFVADARATALVRMITVSSAFTVETSDMIAAIRARPNAKRVFQLRAQKNFVRGLFRRICDLSFAEPGHLDMLWESLRHRLYPPGSLLAREGETELAIHLLARGEAHKTKLESGAAILEVLEVPAYYGESGLLAESRVYESSIVAVTGCNVYTLSRDAFEEISASYPHFRAPLVHLAQAAASRDAPGSLIVATGLARFVPSVVLQRLVQAPLLQPEMSRFPAAVGFIDISGFTKLSMLLHAEQGQRGAETLNLIVNAYVSALMARIQEAGGDTIKFAGDAILVVWGGTQQYGWAGSTFAKKGGSPRRVQRLDELLQDATQCCLELVTKYDDFPTVFSDHSLRLHAGLAAGEVCACYTGGNQSVWEYVVAGTPIEEMSDAANEAKSGELFLSSAALNILERCSAGCAQLGRVGDELDRAGRPKSRRLLALAVPSELESQPLPLPRVGQGIELNSRSEQALRSFVLPFVQRRVSSGQMSTWMSQFRTMTMLFVKINGLGYLGESAQVLGDLQKVVWTVQHFVNRYEGTVLRLIVDDKGTRFKLAFGITSHEDDASRAVLTACQLEEHLRGMSKGRLSCRVGITTGNTFLGDVGSEVRCEYTSTGAHVNLAARLMSAADKEGAVGPIYVDDETRKRAESENAYLQFLSSAELQLKGIDHPVTAYVPSVRETAHRAIDAGERPLVGQGVLVAQLLAHLAPAPGSAPRTGGRVVLLTGPQGFGKTAISQELAVAFKRAGPSRKSIYVPLNSHAASPLCVWQTIFARLLEHPSAAALLHDLTALADRANVDDALEALDAAEGGPDELASSARSAGSTRLSLAKAESRELRERGERERGDAAARREGGARGGVGGAKFGAETRAESPPAASFSARRGRKSAARSPRASALPLPAADLQAGSGSTLASALLPRPDGVHGGDRDFRDDWQAGGGGEGSEAAEAVSALDTLLFATVAKGSAALPETLRRVTSSGSMTRALHLNASLLHRQAAENPAPALSSPEPRNSRAAAVQLEPPPPDAADGSANRPVVVSEEIAAFTSALRSLVGSLVPGSKTTTALRAVHGSALLSGAGGGAGGEARRRETGESGALSESDEESASDGGGEGADAGPGATPLFGPMAAGLASAASAATLNALSAIAAATSDGVSSAAAALASASSPSAQPPSATAAVSASAARDAAAAAGFDVGTPRSRQARVRALRARLSAALPAGSLSASPTGGGGGPGAISVNGRALFVPQSKLLLAQPELAASIPLLGPLLDPRSSDKKIDPNFERFARLLALLLSELLCELGREVLVVVDNVEQMDLLSWRVLAHPALAVLPFHALLATRQLQPAQYRLYAELKRVGRQLDPGVASLVPALALQSAHQPAARVERALHCKIAPLDNEAAIALFKLSLGILHELPAQIEATMLVRAEGSPYIVCEMARHLLDSNLVLTEPSSPDSGGAAAPIRRLSPDVRVAELAELPTAEQRVLLSKMDRLPPAEQRLLRTCSVLALSDESFTVVDVQQLMRLVIGAHLMSAQETDDGLVSAGGDYFGVYAQLMALEKQKLLSLPDGRSAASSSTASGSNSIASGSGSGSGGSGDAGKGELAFSFCKPVIRDVAYATMTYTQRRQIHLVAAQWMLHARAEALREEAEAVAELRGWAPGSVLALADDVWDQLDFVRLARHYGHADEQWRAAKAWQDAGSIAMGSSSFEEALVFAVAGIQAVFVAANRQAEAHAALRADERPSHELLWLLLGIALHHLGFPLDAKGAFAECAPARPASAAVGRRAGVSALLAARHGSSSSAKQPPSPGPAQGGGGAANLTTHSHAGSPSGSGRGSLALSGSEEGGFPLRARRFTLSSIGNGQLGRSLVAEQGAAHSAVAAGGGGGGGGGKEGGGAKGAARKSQSLFGGLRKKSASAAAPSTPGSADAKQAAPSSSKRASLPAGGAEAAHGAGAGGATARDARAAAGEEEAQPQRAAGSGSDPLTQLRLWVSPPLLGMAQPAAAKRGTSPPLPLPLHLALRADEPLTLELVSLLHLAAASVGGSPAGAVLAPSALAQRTHALAARIERTKRHDLAPICAALVVHCGGWRASASERLLLRYEQLARPLLEADLEEAQLDLRVPLSSGWDAGRRAAWPIVKQCRLCAVHLFGLAFLRAGDVSAGRAFAERALEDAIASRSMQLCHSSCLSLAFVLWERGRLLEAGHLLSYVLAVCADLNDHAGLRQVRGCLAVTAAMLARPNGEEHVWAQALSLAVASRVPAIHAFVLWRQPELGPGDVAAVLALLAEQEALGCDGCWFNFIGHFCRCSVLLELLRAGPERSSAEARVPVKRWAVRAVAELKSLSESWLVLRPRALLFEGELHTLQGQPAEAVNCLQLCLLAALELELPLLHAQALLRLALASGRAQQARLLEQASAHLASLQLHSEAALAEALLRKLHAPGHPSKPPALPPGSAAGQHPPGPGPDRNLPDSGARLAALEQLLRGAKPGSHAQPQAQPASGPGSGGGGGRTHHSSAASAAEDEESSSRRHSPGPRQERGSVGGGGCLSARTSTRSGRLSAGWGEAEARRESAVSLDSETGGGAGAGAGAGAGGGGGGGGSSWVKDHVLLIAQAHTNDLSSVRMAQVIEDLGRGRRQVGEDTIQDLSRRVRNLASVPPSAGGSDGAPSPRSPRARLKVDAKSPHSNARRLSGGGGSANWGGSSRDLFAAGEPGKRSSSAGRLAKPGLAPSDRLPSPRASPRAHDAELGSDGEPLPSARRHASLSMRSAVSPGAGTRRAHRNSGTFGRASDTLGSPQGLLSPDSSRGRIAGAAAERYRT